MNQQGEQAVDRACCTRQISQLIHKRRLKHRHETGCDDKERRGGVEELGDARNDTAGLFAKHPQRRRPLPVGVGEVGGHVVMWIGASACPRGWPMSERAQASRREITPTSNFQRNRGVWCWHHRSQAGRTRRMGEDMGQGWSGAKLRVSNVVTPARRSRDSRALREAGRWGVRCTRGERADGESLAR